MRAAAAASLSARRNPQLVQLCPTDFVRYGIEAAPYRFLLALFAEDVLEKLGAQRIERLFRILVHVDIQVPRKRVPTTERGGFRGFNARPPAKGSERNGAYAVGPESDAGIADRESVAGNISDDRLRACLQLDLGLIVAAVQHGLAEKFVGAGDRIAAEEDDGLARHSPDMPTSPQVLMVAPPLPLRVEEKI
jgi:hypothetical protein